MNKLNKDYTSFEQCKESTVPEDLTNKVLETIEKKINPPVQNTIGKAFFLQTISGFLTLLFCPQFGLSLSGYSDLFDFLHRTFGNTICTIICSFIFILPGVIVTVNTLTSDEIRQLSEVRIPFQVSYSIVICALILMTGSESFSFSSVYWIAAASMIASIFTNRNSYLIIRNS